MNAGCTVTCMGLIMPFPCRITGWQGEVGEKVQLQFSLMDVDVFSALGSQTFLRWGRIYLPLPLFIPSQVMVSCAGWTGLWHTEEGSIEQSGVERAPWTQNRWCGIKDLIVLQDPWPPLNLSYTNLTFSSGWELPWVYQNYAGIY